MGVSVDKRLQNAKRTNRHSPGQRERTAHVSGQTGDQSVQTSAPPCSPRQLTMPTERVTFRSSSCACPAPIQARVPSLSFPLNVQEKGRRLHSTLKILFCRNSELFVWGEKVPSSLQPSCRLPRPQNNSRFHRAKGESCWTTTALAGTCATQYMHV